MKTTFLSFFIFFSCFVFGQSNEFTSSDLIGYWKHERTLKLNGERLQVFVRTEKNTKNYFGVWYFDRSGTYNVVYSRRINGRCGNELFSKRHRQSNGIYEFENENQELNLVNKDTQLVQTWKLIRIDRNRFARIIVN